MIVTSVNEGKKAAFKLSGTNLVIGDTVNINLAQRQESLQKNIDVCLDHNLTTMREGLGAWYVANIVIPAREYEIYETGETDEKGNAVTASRALPLNVSKVELKLWGLPEEYDRPAPEVEKEEGVTE